MLPDLDKQETPNMADRGDHLHELPDGYAKFLQEKKLAMDKHQPHLVRWVREFLLFAWTLGKKGGILE